MDIADLLVSSFTPGEKVLVAMSGGVDSSVTAWAAKQAGCDVTGVTLKLFDTEVPFWQDAEKIAQQLDVKWSLGDYRKFFNEDVISPYIATYRRGQTPNPCTICNRVGKTKYLFDEMQVAGAEKIATGHYADTCIHNGRKRICRPLSMEKDQSYYLSLMDPFHIDLMIYPLAKVSDKDSVRQFAKKLGLPVADKKDSFEACFLKGRDYREFLSDKVGTGKQGDFILHGKNMGNHKGTFNYTIGQRRGLDVSHTEPLYVKSIDGKSGEVVLSEKQGVFQSGVRLRNCIFQADESPMFRATAQLRHMMKAAPCTVEIQFDNKAVILFDEPQFAPAPGQVTAIYRDNVVVGGGVVDSCY